MALLAHLARDAEGVATCCSSASGSCKLYEILCRAGRRNDTSVARHISRFNNDAAVGILTLGKRKVGERRVQDRLQQLLHGSRNQAAGILTMGKRFEDGGHLPLVFAGGTVSSPLRLGLERLLKYLMPREPEDLDAYEKR
ncbi:orexin-like [Sinocyclocheilus anshuiensis]|uniref:orexin-like n=1 Tax=Sinocyclocheilus anshuiensis TaxID=1608454 RepID=UPI0007B861A1|nr:PREDICTED: orexin-like [Sinocyclocheilus anshuiensis]